MWVSNCASRNVVSKNVIDSVVGVYYLLMAFCQFVDSIDYELYGFKKSYVDT